MSARLLLMAVLTLPLPAVAQQVSATVSAPSATCTVSVGSSTLSFGTIGQPYNGGVPVSSATVTVQPYGSSTTTNTQQMGSPGPITFAVITRHASSYTVSHPFGGSVTLSGSGGSVSASTSFATRALGGSVVPIGGSSYTFAPGGLRTTSTKSFAIGGSVTISQNQPLGSYTASGTISISCS